MKNFLIITDSCSDLPKKYRDEFNIRYVKNSYSYDGKTFYTDCLDEANILKDIIVGKLNNKNIDIELVYIGQMIGASVGPGMAGIYFWGVPETYNLEEK